MKVRASRGDLAEAVTWVSQAISKKPTMPVLGGIRLTATVQGLELLSTDFVTSHRANEDVEVIEPGECLVSGAMLREVLGGLRTKEVELTFENSALTIEAGRARYTLVGMILADFPSLAKFPKVVGRVDAGALAEAVSTVKYAVDDGTPFEQMRGMHLSGDQGQLDVVGFNRFGGGAVTVPWEGKGEIRCQSPSRQIDAAVRGLTGLVTIGHTEGSLGLSDERREVVLRTFAHEYVGWRSLIRPRNDDRVRIVIDAGEITSAVKRVAAFLGDGGNVELAIGAGEITLDANSDTGAGVETLDAKTDGELVIAFGPRVLLDALSCLPPGDVELGFVDARKVVVVRPVDDPQTAHCLMPKRTDRSPAA